MNLVRRSTLLALLCLAPTGAQAALITIHLNDPSHTVVSNGILISEILRAEVAGFAVEGIGGSHFHYPAVFFKDNPTGIDVFPVDPTLGAFRVVSIEMNITESFCRVDLTCGHDSRPLINGTIPAQQGVTVFGADQVFDRFNIRYPMSLLGGGIVGEVREELVAFTIETVPEPSQIGLAALAAVVFAGRRIRQRRSH